MSRGQHLGNGTPIEYKGLELPWNTLPCLGKGEVSQQEDREEEEEESNCN